MSYRYGLDYLLRNANIAHFNSKQQNFNFSK